MSRKRNILYVGGIDGAVTEEIVHAAFIPFGDLKSVQVPKDYAQNKNRGFAFVEYESEDDAADALENMDGAELFGKVLHCSIAKTAPKLVPGKAVWNAEEWIKENMKEIGDGEAPDDDVEFTALVPGN